MIRCGEKCVKCLLPGLPGSQKPGKCFFHQSAVRSNGKKKREKAECCSLVRTLCPWRTTESVTMPQPRKSTEERGGAGGACFTKIAGFN